MTLGAAASATGSWLSRLRRRLSLPGAEPAASTEPDSSGSGIDKQALKEVIERKRHHDLVRQREFDHLRQLRRRNLNHASEPAHAPTSRFETSILAPAEERESGERETTLRKIDEIEARLARQWWRQAPSAPPGALAPKTPLPDTTLPAERDGSPFAATQGVVSTLPPPLAASPPPRAARRPGPVLPRKPASVSNPLADPALQEAALRFVNDDLPHAETILLTALRAPAAPPPALAGLWLGGLLDLYRRSGQTTEAARARQAFAARCPQPAWQAPALLDPAALVQLEQAVGTVSTTPIWLDWQALRAIAPEALPPLARQLAHWCATPLHLRWRGQARLTLALRALTPPGEQQAGPAAWQARLDVLRLLGLRDQFELVALEYCTTFALTPPQWQEARSHCMLDADAQAAWADAAPLELHGNLRGDLGPTLATWPADPAQAPRLAISCARLERLDFLAAGSLYHWLAAYRTGGGQAQLQEVHPLVAAFLHLCGLGEQAQIVPRQSTE